MYKVIGIVRGVSKETNKPYSVLHMVTDFDDWQLDKAEGNKVETVFLRGQYDISVGQEIDLVYGVGYQGKAIVTGIKILDNSN